MLKKEDQLYHFIKAKATMDNSIEKIKKATISKQSIDKIYNDIFNTCEIKQRQEQERREEEEVKYMYVNLFSNLQHMCSLSTYNHIELHT